MSNIFKLNLSKEEIDNILLELKTGDVTATEIAKRYERNLEWIKSKIRKFYPNYNMKYNRVNHDYFNEIGPDQAYIIGLILADGCINISDRIKKRGGENQWVISLQEKDKYILENIRLKIGQISHVFTSKTKTRLATQFMCSLRICSNKHVEKLGNFGIFPRKSLNVKVSDFFLKDNNLFFHFLRGVFDGDGSLTLSRKGHGLGGTFSICGSYDTCQALSRKLHEDFGIGTGKIEQTSRIYFFRISSQKDIIKLFNLIYQNAGNLFLIRKFEKFKEVVWSISLSKRFPALTSQLEAENFHLQGSIPLNEIGHQE